jgi:hypothetical protein
MKHRSIILIAIVGVTGVAFLVFSSTKARWNHRPGTFIRLTRPHFATIVDTILLPTQAYSIVGQGSMATVLLDRQSMSLVCVDSLSSTIEVMSDSVLASPSSHVIITQESSFIAETSSIHRLRKDDSFEAVVLTPGILTAFAPIDVNTGAFRVLTTRTRQTMLGIVSFINEPMKISKEHPRPGIDSVFSVDGMLAYSQALRHIIYVHYYKNEILHLNLDLNLVFKSQTIDTNTVVRLNTVRLGDKIVMANPPPTVNKTICVDGSLLYVQSTATAKNEVASQLMDNSVIDVYDLTDGHYKYSFYLPNFNGVPLNQFIVKGRDLHALHRELFIRYRLGTSKPS